MTLRVVVRGRVQAARLEQARRMHDDVVSRSRSAARALGLLSHELLVNPADPREVLTIDTIADPGRLEEFLVEPQFLSALAVVFHDEPEVTLWTDPGWASYREPFSRG